MRWILCLKKNNILVLRRVSHKVDYSYSRIPLTDKQAENTLKFSNHWVPVSLGTEYVLNKDADPNMYDKLYRRFHEVVKEHKDELEVVPNKKVKTIPGGTSKLVRNTSKSSIHIARRRKTECTTINVVCIDDAHRDMFFKDSRNCHGRPADGGIYFICDEDGVTFQNWSTYMDNEYARQVRCANSDKL